MSEIPNNQLISSDEIELIKIIKFLLAHWKIIILSIFVFVVIGINNFIKKDSIFQTSVTLETGEYFKKPNHSANLLSDKEIIRFLKVSLMKKSDQNLPEIEFTLIDPKLIQLRLISNSIKNNLDLIDSLMLNIKEKEQEIFNNINQSERGAIRRSIKLNSKLVKEYNEELFRIENWKKVADSTELDYVLGTYEAEAIRQLVILEDEMIYLENSPELQLKETKFVKQPENNTSKSSILAAVFSSMIIGLIAALTFLTLKHFIIVYRNN